MAQAVLALGLVAGGCQAPAAMPDASALAAAFALDRSTPHADLQLAVLPATTVVGVGEASWYGAELAGNPTASGEPFDPEALTAAHPELPFGTPVTVVNLENGRSVEVVINDRGPFVARRIIDVSSAAARLLGFKETGTARVRLEVAPDVPAGEVRPQA